MRLSHKLFIDYYVGSFLHAVLKPPTILAGKILRRNHDLKGCRSITIIKMLGGGSLVIAYPALLAMKRAPGVEKLRILTTPAISPFAQSLGIFDEIIVLRDDSLPALLGDSCAALRKLFRCDAIVDLEIHSRLTTVFSLLTCARNRIGFYTGNSFWRRQISTHLLFCNISNGIYHSYDQIASLFGAAIPDDETCRAEFRAAVRAPLPGSGERPLAIAIAPCCSDLSKERMLRQEEWIRILRRDLPAGIPAGGMSFDLLGGPGDRDNLEQLAGLVRTAFSGQPVVNHAGTTALEESVRQLSRADRLFSIDSALLHYARLLGVPTVSFWGPTDPRSLLRPRSPDGDRIYYRKLTCSPCVHLAQEPPCGGNNLCMRLAADPDRAGDSNPAWVVADGPVRRFFRFSAP
jgi:ADP-heptose:LPS heptosyltransferase